VIFTIFQSVDYFSHDWASVMNHFVSTQSKSAILYCIHFRSVLVGLSLPTALTKAANFAILTRLLLTLECYKWLELSSCRTTTGALACLLSHDPRDDRFTFVDANVNNDE
jgi:hypothetical protein